MATEELSVADELKWRKYLNFWNIMLGWHIFSLDPTDGNRIVFKLVLIMATFFNIK